MIIKTLHAGKGRVSASEIIWIHFLIVFEERGQNIILLDKNKKFIKK